MGLTLQGFTPGLHTSTDTTTLTWSGSLSTGFCSDPSGNIWTIITSNNTINVLNAVTGAITNFRPAGIDANSGMRGICSSATGIHIMHSSVSKLTKMDFSGNVLFHYNGLWYNNQPVYPDYCMTRPDGSVIISGRSTAFGISVIGRWWDAIPFYSTPLASAVNKIAKADDGSMFLFSTSQNKAYPIMIS